MNAQPEADLALRLKARPCRMTAAELCVFATSHHQNLIGRVIETEPYGAWPGGRAEIIKLVPDPADPEIVFQVRHMSALDPNDPYSLWEIGVFSHETIILEPPAKAGTH